jgi:hypothetical protein
MSDADYFAVDAMSASMIKAGATSMLFMQHRMDTPMTASPAMVRGTLGHMAVLEPERFALLPKWDESKRTKAYKEYAASVDGPVISSTEARAYEKQRLQVMNHPEVVRLGLFKEGEPEAEIYWDEDGKAAKCKVDWLGPDYWVEFKTTANLKGFDYTAGNMHYQLQLGWYHRGVATLGKKRKCYIVVQEQSAPYDVAVMPVSGMNCKRWFNRCMEIYNKWLSGNRDGAYPEAFQFELPPRMEDESEPLDVDEQMDSIFGKGESA